jgi:hypothetical protein
VKEWLGSLEVEIETKWKKVFKRRVNHVWMRMLVHLPFGMKVLSFFVVSVSRKDCMGTWVSRLKEVLGKLCSFFWLKR